MAQLRIDSRWDVNLVEQLREKLDFANQMQIENRASVGDNNPLHSPSLSRLARSRATSSSSYSIQTSCFFRNPSSS